MGEEETPKLHKDRNKILMQYAEQSFSGALNEINVSLKSEKNHGKNQLQLAKLSLSSMSLLAKMRDHLNLTFDHQKSSKLALFEKKKDFINDNNDNKLIISKLDNTNSVSIHIRRNRYSDQKGFVYKNNRIKSKNFTNDTLQYINRSIEYFKKKKLSKKDEHI